MMDQEIRILPDDYAAYIALALVTEGGHLAIGRGGYGDSGQIEEIEVKIGDEPGELPDERIEILNPVWGSPDIERQTQTICEAIEAMVYAFLRQTHEGWENNDGGFGDFTFDVAERSISLDYNERYTETNSYSHEF